MACIYLFIPFLRTFFSFHVKLSWVCMSVCLHRAEEEQACRSKSEKQVYSLLGRTFSSVCEMEIYLEKKKKRNLKKEAALVLNSQVCNQISQIFIFVLGRWKIISCSRNIPPGCDESDAERGGETGRGPRRLPLVPSSGGDGTRTELLFIRSEVYRKT